MSALKRFRLMEFLNISSDCLLCGCNVPFNQVEANLRPIKPPMISSKKLCTPCQAHLPFTGQNCFVCGLPSTNTEIPCGECLKSSPPFDRNISAFHYQSPINEFITQFKYSGKLELLPLMASYLELAIEKYSDHSLDLLVPIPLHYKKRNKRGFNQSRLIANILSEKLDVAVSGDEILRVRETKSQASLDANQRKKNLKNAFQINGTLPDRIAIIDDIITTGATVAELASIASKQGAKYIEVWSLARAYSI